MRTVGGLAARRSAEGRDFWRGTELGASADRTRQLPYGSRCLLRALGTKIGSAAVPTVWDFANTWRSQAASYDWVLFYRRLTSADDKRRILKTSVRFEVFTAVTMKNVIFWVIKLQFILHRRHITFPLQITAS
jgi:hypothetical protein